jgi:opacity protein-like surface antigen
MRLKRVLFALVLGAALALPAQARADWFFTPYVGANLGGDTEENSVNFGGSLGFMGAGVFGFEVDFGYSPDFWANELVPTFDGNVTSLMGNLIVGIPIGGQTGGGVRPYVSGGAGLLRSKLDDVDDLFDVDENSFGVNAGGGVMVFFSDNVGARGDLRYFRSLQGDDDEDDLDLSFGSFDFWRASVGITFRF